MKSKNMFQLNLKSAVLLLVIALVGFSCSEDDPIPLRDPATSGSSELEIDWYAVADSIQESLTLNFSGTQGTFADDNQGGDNFQYWPNAHALHVLVDAYERTGDGSYLPRMLALVRGIKTRNGNTYNNVFNDDMLWLGNSSMRAYNATNNSEYLEVAELLWSIIITSHSDVLGGGITWRQDTPFLKNAVSNGPAIVLAMRLYDVTQEQEYLDWALDLYAWQKSNLIDLSNGEVWDNIRIEDGEIIVQDDWIFTYNMGTWIGAGLRLYNETGDTSYLNDALLTARTSMVSPNLTTEGILRDEGDGDGGLFKGIFIRYFTEMIMEDDISEVDREDFIEFFKFNAETFYQNGLSRPEMLSNSDWSSPPDNNVDLKTQLSGVMLIEAAALLEANGVL